MFLKVVTGKKYLLMFYTCYFVTNEMSLHPKWYSIFAAVHSISSVIIYRVTIKEIDTFNVV